MLNKIISWSLNNRILVLALSVIISLTGFYLGNKMPVDIFPNLNKPQVVIMTEAHSMSTEDVEKLITRPIEQALSGSTGVDNIRSQSGMGLSVVTIQFNWGTDTYRNRQIVQEKLQLVRENLPGEIIPQMMPVTSIMGQIQIVSFKSKTGKTPIEEIRTLVDNDIRNQLLAVPGVAKVVTIGGAPKQLQINCDTALLYEYKISITEVVEAVKNRNLNGSGGFINIGDTAPTISINGMVKNISDIEETVISFVNGRSITVKDVAEVKFGPASVQIGDAGMNGHRAILMTIMKQPDADTVEVTKRINTLLTSVNNSFSDLEINTEIFQQAEFIKRAIDNVLEAVRDGSIMVIIILIIFIMNLRISIIALTAIPLSLGISGLIFYFLDLGINTMTLGGIAVAVGALVDDAIVDVENVFRRLKENALLPQHEQKPLISVIYNASSEVRKPILVGTILVIVVYFPLFFLPGMEGILFQPIGIAYIISLLASLIVALVVTPVLCYYLLPSSLKKPATIKETFIVTKLKILASKVINFSILNRKTVIVLTIIIFLITTYLFTRLGTQFLPEFNEGSVQVSMTLPPDTGLAKSTQMGQDMEKALLEIEDVQFIGRRSGRAYGDEHAEGVNKSEALVTFKKDSTRPREEILNDIRTRMHDRFPGIIISTEQPLSHLISHMLSGVYAQVAIKVSGQDMKILKETVEEISREVNTIRGVTDASVEQQVMIPQLKIIPKNEALKFHGINVKEIIDIVENSLAGEEISRLIDGAYYFPITIRLQEKYRQSVDDIANLYLPNANKQLIRLGDIAEVKINKSYNLINHDNGIRRMVFSHNIAGRSLGEVVSEINQKLEVIRKKLPLGYYIELKGQYEAQQKAQNKLLYLSGITLILMFLVLFTHFKSSSLAFQVLASIPMALIGACLYIIIDRQVVSIATLIGLISLGGIATRNAILLIDHYLFLLIEENLDFSIETLIRAGQERLIPVIVTALTSGIALVPIALSFGEPGKELLYPVATVIIGGLISSTLLDFIITPALFWIFGKKHILKLKQK